ncbi:hypothetical protein J6590_056769 [Homalodisca vitripennis]|nr:hypothetical protein J6590_056769 [Homalodisca vitripennis]
MRKRVDVRCGGVRHSGVPRHPARQGAGGGGMAFRGGGNVSTRDNGGVLIATTGDEIGSVNQVRRRLLPLPTHGAEPLPTRQYGIFSDVFKDNSGSAKFVNISSCGVKMAARHVLIESFPPLLEQSVGSCDSGMSSLTLSGFDFLSRRRIYSRGMIFMLSVNFLRLCTAVLTRRSSRLHNTPRKNFVYYVPSSLVSCDGLTNIGLPPRPTIRTGARMLPNYGRRVVLGAVYW